MIFSAAYIRRTVETLEARMDDGWPCWAISNHDVERVASRWGGSAPSNDFIKLLAALVGSLRGSVCIYQGEELGLTEAEVPFEQLQDPYGIAFWPNFKGRDGCRTPMPWTTEAQAGFSNTAPWLPVPETHRAHAVATQERDAGSVLHAFRAFLRWRKSQPALCLGDIRFIDAPEPVLAFTREHAGERVLVALNLGAAAVDVALGVKALAQLDVPGPRAGRVTDGGTLRLPAYAAIFARIG